MVRFVVRRTGRVECIVAPTTAERMMSKAMSMAINENSDVLVEAQGFPPGNWEWGTVGIVQWRAGRRQAVGFVGPGK